MAVWSVFIDESGPMFEPWRRAALGGLALAGTPTQAQAERLRSRLMDVLPGVPWPMHASRMRVAAHRAEAALRGAPRCSEAAWLAAGELRASSEAAAQGLVAAVGPGEADWGVLQAADRWLFARHPRLYRALEDERARAEAALERLLLELCAGGGAFAIGAVDGPAPEESAEARYQRVLGGLLERLVQLVGGSPDVRLVVRTAAFRPDAAPAEAARIVHELPLPGAAPHLTVPRPQHYRGDVHPGLVLADQIANRLHRDVMARETWPQVRTAAGVLPVEHRPAFRADLPDLPTLAAEGLPRDAVRTSLCAGDRVEVGVRQALGRTSPRWHGEQALAWISAVEAR